MRWLRVFFTLAAALLLVLAPIACTPLVLLEQRAEAAYTQSSVTPVQTTLAGRPCAVLSYTETEVGAASEAVVNVPWLVGTIHSVRQDKTAGSGATLNTKIGRTASFTAGTADWILTATATADPIAEQGAAYYYSATGRLYVRASPNAGSDNSVTTELIVCAGAF